MNLVEDYAEIFGILLYLRIESAIYLRKEKCRRHWISVASYAETPLGVSKWLVKMIHVIYPLAVMQGT